MLFLVGVLTDSHDTRHLGKQVILSSDTPGEEFQSSYEELAEFESMRRELEQWKRDLVRCKEEGTSASITRLQQQLEKREEELREMEVKHRRLQLQAHHYPPPAFLLAAGYEGMTNVAVAGCSGVGKSLLVNSMRRVKYGDPTHAPVGTKHTTVAPTMYGLPGEPSVRLWDLPGAGSKFLPRETYPRVVGLRHFDVVILVTGCRFTQTDAEIFRGLCEHGVPTLVVHTMIDLDIANGLADIGQKPTETMRRIAEDLKSKGVLRPYLVNARRPEEHDFPRMVVDMQKALARSRNLPSRSASRRSNSEEHIPPETDMFQAGDAAEVVVLKGPSAGLWARCVVVGRGTHPDCYAVTLPDAPADKREIPNVHISALRRGADPPPPSREPQLLDLETVKEILSAFKEMSGRPDIQTTLAAMDKQGPVTAGLRRIKQKFVNDSLSPALSGIDMTIPREVSPLLMECIQLFQADVQVQTTAHEVESLLNYGAGEFFGIPPREVNGGKTEHLSIRYFPIRDVHVVAQKFGKSWQTLWLFFGCGFFDLLSFATLPGPLFQPVLLVFRTYAHFQRSRAIAASDLDQVMVPLFYAMGATLACMVACLSAQTGGQDLVLRLPASMTKPSTSVARSTIDKLGSFGVLVYVLFVGSGLSLPAVVYASTLGCWTLALMLMSFLAALVKMWLDLEILLWLRVRLLHVVPFMRNAVATPEEQTALSTNPTMLRLAMGKTAVETIIRSKRKVALRIFFGLTVFNTISVVGNCIVRYFTAPLKYALYYLCAVEEGVPKDKFAILLVPVVDASAIAAGAIMLQLVARLRGEQAVAHYIPETGWELAKGAIEGYGSLGAALGALFGGSPSADPLLAASAAVAGCSLLLAPVVLFLATTVRSVVFLEGTHAAIKVFEELTVTLEDKDE